MSAPEFNNPHNVAQPLGAYSHSGWVKAGSDILYIAGQVGNRPDGSLCETFTEQAEQAFANIVRILEAHGLTTANLVKTNMYVVHGHPAMVVRDIRKKYFGDARPASTFVYVPQLVDAKYFIEIEAIAAR
jgi:ribosomal-protein-alanine N-acetyltransferase